MNCSVLGEAAHLSELLIVGRQTRRFDFSKKSCGALKNTRVMVNTSAKPDQAYVDGKSNDVGIL